MKKFVSATVILATTSGAALAHPGEHQFSIVNSLIHLLSEPDHLAIMGLAVIVSAAVIFKFKRRSI